MAMRGWPAVQVRCGRDALHLGKVGEAYPQLVGAKGDARVWHRNLGMWIAPWLGSRSPPRRRKLQCVESGADFAFCGLHLAESGVDFAFCGLHLAEPIWGVKKGRCVGWLGTRLVWRAGFLPCFRQIRSVLL